MCVSWMCVSKRDSPVFRTKCLAKEGVDAARDTVPSSRPARPSSASPLGPSCTAHISSTMYLRRYRSASWPSCRPAYSSLAAHACSALSCAVPPDRSRSARSNPSESASDSYTGGHPTHMAWIRTAELSQTTHMAWIRTVELSKPTHISLTVDRGAKALHVIIYM